jgi:hypothetical protein
MHDDASTMGLSSGIAIEPQFQHFSEMIKTNFRPARSSEQLIFLDPNLPG